MLLNFLEEAQLDRVGASPIRRSRARRERAARRGAGRGPRGNAARLMDFQEDISTQRLEAKIDREMTVLVDEGRRGRRARARRATRPRSTAWSSSPRATARAGRFRAGAHHRLRQCTTLRRAHRVRRHFVPEPSPC